jgi:dipeptidase
MKLQFSKMRAVGLMAAAALVMGWGAQSHACTNLIAGKKATIDGSTMITYAADSHTLFGFLDFYPAADHKPGDVRKIIDWDTGKYLGDIPEVAHTYKVVGNINEHQVTVAESTWGGRHECEDTTGRIDYGSLIYIALQRSKTAREALKVMTDLVAQYGYCSEGESFSVGDPNEVWVLEMIGKGGKEKGAVWVAIRIPDDCISGHANQARIHKIPFKDKENCMYSKDVVSFARKMGWFNGKDEDFDFSNTYCPADYGTLRGCDARAWSFFNRYKAGMDRYLPYLEGKKGAEIMPLYVKPDKLVSVRDMQNMMRDHFEGTPYDMTQDPGAKNYFNVPYRYRPMEFKVDSVTYSHERAIATQQTGFVFCTQMRSWLPDAIGGIIWFGVDDANTAVFVPMYCCINEVPDSYREGKGDLYTFDFDAAFWVNNLIANQCYHRYSQMIPDVRRVQQGIEDAFQAQQPQVEAKAAAIYKNNPADAIEFLTNYSVNSAQDATHKYQDLAKYLFVKFLDGNIKKEKDGKFERNPYGNPVQPKFGGYTQDYFETIVKGSGDYLRVKEVEK